jgi:hypothetical protein
MQNLKDMYRLRTVERAGDVLRVTFDRAIDVATFSDYIKQVYAEKSGKLVYAKDCDPFSNTVKRYEVCLVDDKNYFAERSLFTMNGDSRLQFQYRALLRDKATENEFCTLQSALEDIVISR